MKINGIIQEDIVTEEDIIENGNFTGYNKKIYIKDYVYIKEDNTKMPNLLKQITVEISYKFEGKDKNVRISTYITKE